MQTTLALAGQAAHWVGPVAGGFGFLFLLIPLFWIGVVILFVSLARRRFRRGWGAQGAFGYGHPGFGNSGFGHPGFSQWASAARSAETTLAERFAQGDIDEKEYRARLEVIRANAFPPHPPQVPQVPQA